MITGSQKPGFSHLWVFYGFFMGFYGFLWVFYGFLMGFYGFFYGNPCFFPILNPLWSNISAKTIYGVLSGPMVPHVACMDASEKEVQVPSHPEGNCRRGRGPPFEREFHILWSGGQDFRACRARWRDQGLHGAAIHKMVSDVHNALGKRDRIDPAKVGSLTQKRLKFTLPILIW